MLRFLIPRWHRRHRRLFAYARIAAGILLAALGLLLFLFGLVVVGFLELGLAAVALWLGFAGLDATRSQPPRT